MSGMTLTSQPAASNPFCASLPGPGGELTGGDFPTGSVSHKILIGPASSALVWVDSTPPTFILTQAVLVNATTGNLLYLKDLFAKNTANQCPSNQVGVYNLTCSGSLPFNLVSDPCTGRATTLAGRSLGNLTPAPAPSPSGGSNGGFGFDMWASIVDRDGIVCAVAYSGDRRDSQWPGSRIIAAQKAYTANAFSLPQFALSTANLFHNTQGGQSLFGLQFSNPVDTERAYASSPAEAANYGTTSDPMIGDIVGGVNVFGGGLALYSCNSIIGAIGVSGDTSCADHMIAWKLRSLLNLDYVPAGPNSQANSTLTNDNIIFTYPDGAFSQPHCLDVNNENAIVNQLPPTQQPGACTSTTIKRQLFPWDV